MIEKLDRILTLFSLERTGLTGPDIAMLLDLPRSTAYQLLGSFSSAGFLNRDQDSGRFRLGVRRPGGRS